MTILKIRQPVEYSFLQWINNYPDSGHWADLDAKPHFDPDFLYRLFDLFENLIQFHKTLPCFATQLVTRETVKKRHYIEIRVKKEVIYEVELPLET